MLAGKKIVILEKRETFNVNHKMALVKCGTVSSPGLSLAGREPEDSITYPVTQCVYYTLMKSVPMRPVQWVTLHYI